MSRAFTGIVWLRCAIALAVLAGTSGCMLNRPAKTPAHDDNVKRASGHSHRSAPGIVPPLALPNDPNLIAEQLEDVHLLNVGDQVEIRFPFRPTFDQLQIVRDDGRISLPLIEPVMAAGKTPELLRDELQAIYASLSYNPIANNQDTEQREYVIHVGDELEIRFDTTTSQEDFNDTVKVRPDGKISLARVGSIVVEGKSPEKLESELIGLYSKFLRNPKLVVIVRSSNSQMVRVDGKLTRLGLTNLDGLTVSTRRLTPRVVYVMGEVRTPGFYGYQAPMTALRSIVAAGGPQRSGKLREVLILRDSKLGPPLTMKVDLQSQIDGYANTDIPLRPFDIVVVPKTHIARVKDFLDQYLYDIVPMTRNSSFLFLYDLKGNQSFVPNPVSSSGR